MKAALVALGARARGAAGAAEGGAAGAEETPKRASQLQNYLIDSKRGRSDAPEASVVRVAQEGVDLAPAVATAAWEEAAGLAQEAAVAPGAWGTLVAGTPESGAGPAGGSAKVAPVVREEEKGAAEDSFLRADVVWRNEPSSPSEHSEARGCGGVPTS